jgi:indolepyruvate ferredoxin oxidoreductase
MTATSQYQLNDRYQSDEGTVFLTGIQALARLPLEQLRADRRAGLNTAAFVSGYQGSPLGGYGQAVEAAARVDSDLPITFRQAMNEEYGATAVMGSQLASARPDARHDGVVGIWYGKAPGVDRAADALRHAVYAGTSMHGGAIALVGDDPNAKSSTVPSSSAGQVFGMHMPLLYPGDPGEALDLGRHAIAMSRATGLWSAVKIVADVADATASIHLHPDRVRPVMPLMDGSPYQHTPYGQLLTPMTVEIEREIVEVRYELARRYAADNKLNYITVNPTDAWVGIVSSGITYREVREALDRLGLHTDHEIEEAGIRLLKMGMPMPFNPRTIREFAHGLSELIVVEEKQPNIESLIKDALYATADRPVIVGKSDEREQPMLPGWGALDADTIVPVLRARLAARLDERLAPLPRERMLIPLAVERAPFFCSGCPHNRSTEVPEGAVVGAGIGCHTMTLLMDPERVGDIAGLTCMGNEGTQWIGMSEFVETNHLFQNLGDGTFFHSGQLAIQAAIAAGVNITYKLLWNSTVAMTGGQDPEGQLPLRTVAQMLVTQGVERVLITTDDLDRDRGDLPKNVDVWDRSRLIEAQEVLAATPGVTVLIHDQECAAEARRDRKRGRVDTPPQRIVINQRICEGCGDCGQVSNCLSVQPIDTVFGRKTHIDQTTCNLDYSCVEGDCPSFMTVTTEKPGRIQRFLSRRTPSMPSKSKDTNAELTPQPPSTFTKPEPIVPTDSFALRITGIGGTGVVTVAQILGTAAMLAGYEVRGLDQIGLSQKAGPVVSDLRLSRAAPAYTNRLGDRQADLLLAFDQLVAASDKGLSACDSNRTVVVGSTSTTPTGAMITHPDIVHPTATSLADTIGQHTTSHHFWADAQTIAEDLLGSTTAANIFVVGMAVQAGALPIDPEFFERAIALNGVAIASNTAAFRWGRLQVSDPAQVNKARAHVESVVDIRPLTRFAAELDALGAEGARRSHLAMLADELEAWGRPKDADRWFAVLERVRRAEWAIDTTSDRLVDAVADGLFKLTAYKDEYEVARLMVDADGLAEANELVATGGRMSYQLHPPMLRAWGLDKKISIPATAAPALGALAKGKRLRGTFFDPFRWAEVRRVERKLAAEYVDAVETALTGLSAESFDTILELAQSPDIVRGYEDIKLANVTHYRAKVTQLLTQL